VEENMMITFLVRSFLTVCLAAGAVSESHALTMTSFGQAVTGFGSNVQAVPTCATPSSPGCFNPVNGNVNFYIPINPADNGVFGVTTTPGGLKAGTFADTNTAPFNNTNSLTMYLRFSPIAPLLLASATLTFSFVDLDLIGGSDPTGFTETMTVYGSGGALSPTITMLGQSGTTPLAFNVSGNSTSQTVTFPDVRSVLLGDPFYVKLVFGANMTAPGQWTNTLESMTATLTTTTVTPEPSSLLLFGTGLAAAAAWRVGRRKPR
jgi:hypothetical protein